MLNNLISISDLKPAEFLNLIERGIKIKHNPKRYYRSLFEKTLLMMFQAPSLRTRLSFEVAMTQLEGHAINYYMEHSPWAHGKESIEDVARVIGKYCDVVMARIYSHADLKKLAKNTEIPVINAMTNNGHPCQILGDFMTIKEKLKKIKGLKLVYLGDSKNNVTYSLMRASALTGNEISIACPSKKDYYPERKVIEETKKLAKKHKGKITITTDPKKAVKNADIIFTDSWMSYRIPEKEKNKRIKELKPFQVNKKLFSLAKKSALFMHNLPALRGHEVTADVIDSKKSIVFEQAANRLPIQKAILLELLGK